jgi:transcriptional regulator with XRE-family HTH domain
MDTKSLYKEIGARILNARTEKGLSQEEASLLLDVTRVTWNHMERGVQKITIDRLLEISRILDKKYTDFIPDPEDSFDASTQEVFQQNSKISVLEELNKIKLQITEEGEM